MQYLLMLYVDEAGWPKMSESDQEQGIAAYAAYGEALRDIGRDERQQSAAANLDRDDGAEHATARRRCWMALMSIRRSSWAATF